MQPLIKKLFGPSFRPSLVLKNVCVEGYRKNKKKLLQHGSPKYIFTYAGQKRQ